jgi:hypothetical protein
MRDWNLIASDPQALTLACDARSRRTDYVDDQIWELSIGGGDPPGLVVQTTYGLRARSHRIFPRFSQKEIRLTDPKTFSKQPAVQRIYPNYIALSFAPFKNIDVIAELWVPEPKTIAGRYSITNHDIHPQTIDLEIIGQLAPNAGQRLAPHELEAVSVLAGESDQIRPVLFVTGGPAIGSGSYPSLIQTIDLAPEETRLVVWSQAALSSIEESFELARRTAARRWEAELAVLDLLNTHQIEIYTGDTDWDAALMLAQKQAMTLILSATDHLPNSSFVLTRQPDLGYSLRGDGSDYNHLWNGQTALDAYFLADYLLPGAQQIAAGILENFLEIQAEDGSIDWKPGLGGQRGRIQATPLLANLAWRIYECNQDIEFLRRVFPGLLNFLKTWFSPEHDRDNDGIPEWDHPNQAGTEDHPSYARWGNWSLGIDITTAEQPSLAALLYQECQKLITMAEIIAQPEPVPTLVATAEKLRLAIEISWDPESASYRDVDRDTHFSTRGEQLTQLIGPGTAVIDRSFDQPVRLLIHIDLEENTRGRPYFVIQGTSATGQPRVEQVAADKIRWHFSRGTYTGERVYQTVEQIEIMNIAETAKISISTSGYTEVDITCALPLWAEIPDPERASHLVEKNISNPARFWRPYGLPTCLATITTTDAPICQNVSMLWNSFIGAGLIRYGYRELAADLVNRLMTTVVRSLKQDQAFRRGYHCETGHGIGEWNMLHGLAPLSLFLDTLGVRVLSAGRVSLEGQNPFPWPVTVKYRGVTILRLQEKSTVIFPDGQIISIDDPAPQIITLE